MIVAVVYSSHNFLHLQVHQSESEDSEVIKFEQAVPIPSSCSSIATIPAELPRLPSPPLPENNNPWDLVPDQYKFKQHSRLVLNSWY